MSAISPVRDPFVLPFPTSQGPARRPGGPTIADRWFVPIFGTEEITMLLALAAVLAIGWFLAFFVLHVSAIAIHVLALGAVLCAVVQFIHVRRVHHRPQPRL
jgi:hypothetical protein